MSSLNIFSELFQLVWPLLAIFGLIISLRAKQRHPGQGSSLMVAGSAISVLVSIFHAVSNFSMRYDWFGYEDIAMYYSLTNILSMLAQVLFLVGLLTLINTVRSGEEAPLSRF
jgi:hypothetical protein